MLGLGKEQVLTSSETADMAHLYLSFVFSIQSRLCSSVCVPFYVRQGRIRIGREVLGSTLHGCSAKSSSVISAYWPTFRHNIQQFNQSRPSIGKVQYYFSHSVTLTDNQAQISENMQYTFAYIHWMEYHHQYSSYGISATVSANLARETSLCSITPVLRIAAKCASCTTTLNDETVFVAAPIPLKLCI